MKKRGSQIYPSQQRRAELARMLDEMATAGDVNAAGWLLLLSEIKHPKSEAPQ
ncbi:hypothetical protein [Vreelandella sp. TE19]